MVKGLSNSTVVEWQNLGHVAAALDPKLCASASPAELLKDPSAQPDVRCSQTPGFGLVFALT